MTTRPPTGPNDPAAGRGADATADALDAMLNRIAQGMGGTASRSGHAGQNGQPSLSPADEDLLAATGAFHRRFVAAEARSQGARGPSPDTWEKIMQQSSSPALPGQQRQTGGRFLPPRTSQPTVSGAPGRPHPGMQPFRVFANATLALVLILVALGGWRAWDNSRDTGSPPPATSVPGFAMLPATPDAAIATVETPEPAYACDFSRDIPILTDVTANSLPGTVLVLDANGTLTLHCPEEPDPINLATNVSSAYPQGYPGIVSVSREIPGQGNGHPVTMINIATGNSAPLGFRMGGSESTSFSGQPGPIVASATDGSDFDWTFTDLRTMQSVQLSDFVDPATITPNIPSMSASNGTGSFVFALRTSTTESGNGHMFGNALVFDGALDRVHQIATPEGFDSITEFDVSPTGTTLAVQNVIGSPGPGAGKTTYTYGLLDLATGDLLGRSADIVNSLTGMRWVQDGSALAYTQGNDLVTLATEPGSTPQVVFTAEDDLAYLATTTDPEVVIVDRMQAEEVATETPGQVRPLVYIVNVATGEVIEVEGWNVGRGFVPWPYDTQFLAMVDSDTWQSPDEQFTVRFVDALTGEEIDRATVSIGGTREFLGPHAVASSDDGETLVIGFGTAHLYLLQMVDGVATVRHLDMPASIPADSNGAVTLVVAGDGTMLTMTREGDESRTRYLLDLTDSAATWTEIPTDVAGSGSGTIWLVPVPVD